MDDGLKQRLVGAAVLVALAVLFLPVLFEPERRTQVDRTTQIPPAPDIKPIHIEAPVDNLDIPPVRPAEDMYELVEVDDPVLTGDNTEKQGVKQEAARQDNTSAAKVEKGAAEASSTVTSTTKPASQILDERGIPKAWAVQVASFHEEPRALALRDKLLSDDYPAFTRGYKTSSGMVTRVYVGPKISQDTATSLKSELDQKLQLETLVVTFRPR